MKRLIEALTWLAGLALVGAYIVMRGSAADAAEHEISRMSEARAQYAANGRSALRSAVPDTSSWSPKRLAAYRESLRHETSPAAVLRIPRLGLQVPVYEGTDDDTLNRGAGRIVSTAGIDSRAGNVGIAAHRDGFFRPLKDIAVGDELYLDTVAETRLYRVSRIHVVDPDDVGVLDPTPMSTITLVTCYPFYFVGTAPRRFIVHAQVTQQRYADDGG